MDGTGMGWDKVGQYLVALLTALGGLKVFQLLKNWGTDNRKERASAEESELEVLRKHVNWLEERLRKKTAEADESQKSNLNLMKRAGELEIKLRDAQSRQCLVPNDKCLRRIPQPVECRMREWMIREYKKDVPGVIITDGDMLEPYKEGEAEQIMKEDGDESDGVP